MSGLDAWKDSLRERMVPPGFAEAVQPIDAGRPSWIRRLWARPAVRVATWLVAGIALSVRLAAAFAFFLLS